MDSSLPATVVWSRCLERPVVPSLRSTCLCLLAIPAMAGPGRQIAWANAGCVLPREQASKAEYLHSLAALGYEHVKGAHVAYPVNLWLLLCPGQTAILPLVLGKLPFKWSYILLVMQVKRRDWKFLGAEAVLSVTIIALTHPWEAMPRN